MKGRTMGRSITLEAESISWGGSAALCQVQINQELLPSSTKIMQGWSFSASVNTARTRREASPSHLERMEEAEMLRKKQPDCLARALASIVLPYTGRGREQHSVKKQQAEGR